MLNLPTARVDLDGLILHRNGQTHPLTLQEADLLKYLANAKRTVPRAELLVKVWGYAPTVSSRAVDATVSRLRSKLEADPTKPKSLLSVRGKGYRLEVFEAVLAPSTLFGRGQERRQLRRLLETEHRVQLIGRGGAGKTSLARDLVGDSPALFVDLTECTRASDAVAMLASMLELDLSREKSDQTLERVLAVCENESRTIILDNIEQLEPAFDDVLKPLGQVCNSLVLTSREARLDWPVLNVGSLAGEPARALLRRAAHRVRPDFDLDTEVLDAVVGLVDGLPLALELIGSQLPTVSVELLEQRPHTLLALGDGRLGRHSTLSKSIAWSLSLLSETDQQRVRQWSVLVSGLHLEALESFEAHGKPGEILQTLGRLARLGWLDTHDEVPRFWSSVRDFLTGQLDAIDKIDIDAAHERWLLEVLARNSRSTPSQTAVLRADLVAAFHRASEPATVAQLGLGLLGVPKRLPAREALEICERTVAAADQSQQLHLRIEARLAQRAQVRGRRDPSWPMESLDILRELLEAGGSDEAWAKYWIFAGNEARSQGHMSKAIDCYRQGRVHATRKGRSHESARLDHDEGAALRRMGQFEAARQLLLRCASTSRDLGLPRLQCLAYQALASISRANNEAAASRFGEIAVKAGREANDDYALGGALTNLANIELTRRNVDAAILLNREAVQLLRRGGYLVTLCVALGNLALCVGIAGDDEESELLMSDALETALRVKVPYAAAVWNSCLADRVLLRGATQAALTRYSEAIEALRAQDAHPQLETVLAISAVAHAEASDFPAAARALDEARSLAEGSDVDTATLRLCRASVALLHGKGKEESFESKWLQWAAAHPLLRTPWRLYERSVANRIDRARKDD